ncbi:Ig-like domain-containing protein [Butyrivibrio sp. MC2021]|uniref:Ig-like domain-containing protein n=1 Tax=Butyrivibrio sp. MC2021 TaxID=1408306 RepID=UPI000479EEC0|nr:Ig-like domain-containing protein [Butyrivibrio sp. MC2021]
MIHKRLVRMTTAVVMAAALMMQTPVAFAAEEDFFPEEEEYCWEIEEEIPEEDSDRNLDEEATEETEEEFEEELYDSVSETEEEEITVDLAEEASEAASYEASEEDMEESDVSGDESFVEAAEITDVTASKNPITKVVIQSGMANSTAVQEHYKIVSDKNGTLKSAALTLGSEYKTMKLQAVQTRKDNSQAKDAPSWKSSNPKAVTVESTGNTVTVKAVGKGKAKISCVASDGSGKSASVTITVRQNATDLEISGNTCISAGKSASYKATPVPSNSDNKKVTWEIEGKVDGVKVGSDGKVSVAKNVKSGTRITLVAHATEIPGIPTKVSSKKVITVKDKAKTLTLNAPEDTNLVTEAAKGYKTSLTLSAFTDNNETVSWKMDKQGIVSIKETENNKVTVKALSTGSVKVTAYTTDGSKLSKSVKITVIVPVTSIDLTVPEDRSDNYLALGCSLKFTAVLNKGKEAPTISKLKWDYEIVGFDSKQEKKITLSDKTQKLIKDKKYFFTLDKSGKVTAASPKDFEKQAAKLWDETGAYQYAIVVKAETTDGSGISAQKLVKRVKKNTSISINKTSCSVHVNGTNTDVIVLKTAHGVKEFYVSYSNPGVANAWVDSGNQVWIKGLSTGSTKVTFKAKDGTGDKIKATISVNVVR